MNRARRYKRLLLQLLLIVFSMNTTVVYGACCMASDASMTAGETQTSMPCHEVKNDKHPDLEKCCAACFAMSLPTSDPVPTGNSISKSDELPMLITGIPAPPFRPPITQLS